MRAIIAALAIAAVGFVVGTFRIGFDIVQHMRKHA